MDYDERDKGDDDEDSSHLAGLCNIFFSRPLSIFHSDTEIDDTICVVEKSSSLFLCLLPAE